MIPLKGTDKSFEMNGHKGKIKSLVFSYDSKQLYSAALDGKVLKWEISARTYTDVSTGSNTDCFNRYILTMAIIWQE